MKLESRPQTKRPNESIRGGLLALDHLTPGLKLIVETVKHVPHQRGGIAHDVLCVPDRIKIGEIGLRHEAQHARGPALRDRWGGKSAGRGQDADTGRGLDERASIHDSRPVRAQTILATPQKNGSGPGAIPVTFFRQA